MSVIGSTRCTRSPTPSPSCATAPDQPGPPRWPIMPLPVWCKTSWAANRPAPRTAATRPPRRPGGPGVLRCTDRETPRDRSASGLRAGEVPRHGGPDRCRAHGTGPGAGRIPRPFLKGRALLGGRPYCPRTVAAASTLASVLWPATGWRRGAPPSLTVRENFLANPRAGGSCHRCTGSAPGVSAPRPWPWWSASGVHPRNGEAPIATLSGGNQQKVMVGRCLRVTRRPPADPGGNRRPAWTSAPRQEIYRLLDAALAAGLAVVLISTDFQEVIDVCHRVLVFVRGTVVAELTGEVLTVTALTGPRGVGDAASPPPERQRPDETPVEPRVVAGNIIGTRRLPIWPSPPCSSWCSPSLCGDLSHVGQSPRDPVHPFDPGDPRARRDDPHRHREVRPLHRLWPRLGHVVTHSSSPAGQHVVPWPVVGLIVSPADARRRGQRPARRIRPGSTPSSPPSAPAASCTPSRAGSPGHPDRPGPAVFRRLHRHATSSFLGLPLPVLLPAGPRRPSAVLERLPLGRYLYVIGSNPRAADLVGIPTPPILLYAFVGSGLVTGFAGCPARRPAADRQSERRARLPAARLRRRPARLHRDQTRPGQRPGHPRRRRRPGHRPVRHRQLGAEFWVTPLFNGGHPALRGRPGRLCRPPPAASGPAAITAAPPPPPSGDADR